MASTFSAVHIHLVFSTKERTPWISQDLEARLWAYLGGLASRHGMTAVQVGGVEDHVHALIGLPATLSVSRAAQLLKGGSSRWLRLEFPELQGFAWQDGYGAFSVSTSQVERVRRYIKNQRAHHEGHTFEDEYRSLLKAHGFVVAAGIVLG